MGYNLLKTDKIGLAYNVFLRAGELDPRIAAIWHNIGKCFHEADDNDKAEEFFRKAVKIQPNYSPSWEGLCLTSIQKGEFGLGIEQANRSLAESPDATESKVNRGMCYLALQRWVEGWRDYNANIGKEKNRIELQYGDEPRWDGTKGLDLVVYGEQGIGDEISFASCIPDLVRDSKSVTIECDGRLEGLFKRSFPDCTVHGTRYKDTRPAWKDSVKFDAHVAIGALPEFYRKKDSDFPGTPYLKPHPQMALQWKTLLDSISDKPKIGIAWSGGIKRTGQRRRSVTLDTLAPLFKYDAEFVSLQYKEYDEIPTAEEKYGVKIHDFRWGTGYDYDTKVALVSQLDLVISVQTSIVHVAGGLGIPCWCLVPRVPMWRYLQKGEWFPWAKSVSLYRQKGREWPVHLLLGKLKDTFGERPRHS
jgi:tetratricopeptide (TPR) repeat protein